MKFVFLLLFSGVAAAPAEEFKVERDKGLVTELKIQTQVTKIVIVTFENNLPNLRRDKDQVEISPDQPIEIGWMTRPTTQVTTLLDGSNLKIATIPFGNPVVGGYIIYKLGESLKLAEGRHDIVVAEKGSAQNPIVQKLLTINVVRKSKPQPSSE